MAAAASPSARIVLDTYHEGDEAAFIAWCDEPDTFTFLRKSWPRADSPTNLFRWFLERSQGGVAVGRVWSVRLHDGDLAVGHIELKQTDKTGRGEGEVVLLIAPACRGRGFGAAAIQTLVTTDHTRSGFNTALAVCRPTNHASVRIVQRAGFRLIREEQGALWFRCSFEQHGPSVV